MKGVLLYTDDGLLLMGGSVCSNDIEWSATTCYHYCNSYKYSKVMKELQADKLKSSATLMNQFIKKDKDWYESKSNFVDVMINEHYEDEDYKKLKAENDMLKNILQSCINNPDNIKLIKSKFVELGIR